jgi:hypothetical protein
MNNEPSPLRLYQDVARRVCERRCENERDSGVHGSGFGKRIAAVDRRRNRRAGSVRPPSVAIAGAALRAATSRNANQRRLALSDWQNRLVVRGKNLSAHACWNDVSNRHSRVAHKCDCGVTSTSSADRSPAFAGGAVAATVAGRVSCCRHRSLPDATGSPPKPVVGRRAR